MRIMTMKCQLCLGCTAQGERDFVEPRMCKNFVEDRTNREKEYEQVKVGDHYEKKQKA
jgi:hypothetical protein